MDIEIKKVKKLEVNIDSLKKEETNCLKRIEAVNLFVYKKQEKVMEKYCVPIVKEAVRAARKKDEEKRNKN